MDLVQEELYKPIKWVKVVMVIFLREMEGMQTEMCDVTLASSRASLCGQEAMKSDIKQNRRTRRVRGPRYHRAWHGGDWPHPPFRLLLTWRTLSNMKPRQTFLWTCHDKTCLGSYSVWTFPSEKATRYLNFYNGPKLLVVGNAPKALLATFDSF